MFCLVAFRYPVITNCMLSFVPFLWAGTRLPLLLSEYLFLNLFSLFIFLGTHILVWVSYCFVIQCHIPQHSIYPFWIPKSKAWMVFIPDGFPEHNGGHNEVLYVLYWLSSLVFFFAPWTLDLFFPDASCILRKYDDRCCWNNTIPPLWIQEIEGIFSWLPFKLVSKIKSCMN